MNLKLKAIGIGVLFFTGHALVAQKVEDSVKVKEKEIEGIQITVAYGKQRREEITGSVTQLKSEILKTLQNADVLQGLAGKVSGVQIISGGQPGDTSTIRMRGIGSIYASSSPLIVLDGIPYNGTMNSIPSQDIESMSFLKDASSNALYGSRGANGVIMITTKTARKKGIQVEFDTKTGINTRAMQDYDIIRDPEEYYMAYYDRLRMSAIKSGSTNSAAHSQANTNLKELAYNAYNVPFDQLITNGVFNPNAKLLYKDDWSKELFSPSMRYEQYLSVSSSTEKSKTFFSANYLKDNGYSLGSGFTRLSARLNSEYNVTKDVKLGANISYANTNYISGSRGSGYSNAFNFSRGVSPIYPVYVRDANYNFVYDKNGKRVFDFGMGEFLGAKRLYASFQNPVGGLQLDDRGDKYDNISSRFFVSYKFLKDFDFTYNFSADIFNRNYHEMRTSIAGDAAKVGGRLTRYNDRQSTLAHQQLLNWNKKIKKHNFSVLLGHESNKWESDYIDGQKTNLLDNIPSLTWGGTTAYLNGGKIDYTVEGYLSRLNYNFSNKYFFNASVRRDGSSVFSPESRWGTFYGLGLAWQVTKENFLSESKIINNLKLKGSYGTQGNDNLLDNQSVPERIYYGYKNSFRLVADGQGGVVPQRYLLGNSDLKWETSVNINAGFEASFLHNRINIDAEYFQRKVSDMLYYLPIADHQAMFPYPGNIGDMKNTGLEFSIDGTIVKTDKVKWNIFGNLTHYKNVVTRIPKMQSESGGIVTSYFKLKEGHSRYEYFLYSFAGVDQKNGDALWWGDVKDLQGNIVGREKFNDISKATQYYTGKSAIPNIYGGFGTELSIGMFDMRVNFAYQFGGYGYDSIYQELLRSNSDTGANYHRDVFKSWTPENPSAVIPRIDRTSPTQNQTSSFYLIKSDYVSLQDVTLGYNFGKSILDVFKLSSARVYCTGSNLYLWSKRKGYDPRLNVAGVSNTTDYSALKTISVGVNIKF